MTMTTKIEKSKKEAPICIYCSCNKYFEIAQSTSLPGFREKWLHTLFVTAH